MKFPKLTTFFHFGIICPGRFEIKSRHNYITDVNIQPSDDFTREERLTIAAAAANLPQLLALYRQQVEAENPTALMIRDTMTADFEELVATDEEREAATGPDYTLQDRADERAVSGGVLVGV